MAIRISIKAVFCTVGLKKRNRRSECLIGCLIIRRGVTSRSCGASAMSGCRKWQARIAGGIIIAIRKEFAYGFIFTMQGLC